MQPMICETCGGDCLQLAKRTWPGGQHVGLWCECGHHWQRWQGGLWVPKTVAAAWLQASRNAGHPAPATLADLPEAGAQHAPA